MNARQRLGLPTVVAALLAVVIPVATFGATPAIGASAAFGATPATGLSQAGPDGTASSTAVAGSPAWFRIASAGAGTVPGLSPGVARAAPVIDPPPVAGPFSMDLYRRGDFVSEMNKVSCVPAAMQTMMNIMTPGADATGATQRRLYALARKLSPRTLKGDGAEPEGWARGLGQLGFGPYVVAVQPTRTLAIKAAARALRLTGRPVGLLAWRGAHSWVMSGFTATADPAFTDRFTVTAVNIEDVWYPRISSIWGPSRPPDTLVPVRLLGEDLLPWRRPTGGYPGKDGKYELVLPVVPAD